MESTHNSIPDVPGRDDYLIPMPDDATDGSSDHNLIQHANQAFSSSSRVRSRDEGIEHPIQVANLLVPNKIIQLYRDNVSHLRDQLVKVADESAIEAGRSNEKHSDRNLEYMGELENLLRRYNKAVRSLNEISQLPKITSTQITMNSSLMPERTAHNHNLRVMTSAGDVRRNVGGRDTPPEETRPSRRSTNTNLKHFGGKINEKHLKVLGSLPLLLAPIILLTLLKGVVARLIIVSLFLSFFALIGAVMTKARSWEVIAATAAYAAMMVTLMRD